MKTDLKSLVGALALLASPLFAAEQLLIIGDSLSKEYEYELAGIGGNSDAQGIMSWTEILDEYRHGDFDFGGSAIRPDLRLIGHKHNWSLPGSFARQWVDYLDADFPMDYVYGIPELEDQLQGEVERVVVFLGGNDIRTNYEAIYKGKSSTKFINDTFNNITSIVNWVRSRNSKLQVVLVGVPHIGCTPKTNGAHPYNATKTGRVTTTLTTLNNKLAAFAAQKKIAYCGDIFTITKGLLTSDRLLIGGVPVYKNPPHADGDPHYLFLGDGFHPNQPCQAVFAQRILDCFNARYNLGIPRLSDKEILSKVLGL